MAWSKYNLNTGQRTCCPCTFADPPKKTSKSLMMNLKRSIREWKERIESKSVMSPMTSEIWIDEVHEAWWGVRASLLNKLSIDTTLLPRSPSNMRASKLKCEYDYDGSDDGVGLRCAWIRRSKREKDSCKKRKTHHQRGSPPLWPNKLLHDDDATEVYPKGQVT